MDARFGARELEGLETEPSRLSSSTSQSHSPLLNEFSQTVLRILPLADRSRCTGLITEPERVFTDFLAIFRKGWIALSQLLDASAQLPKQAVDLFLTNWCFTLPMFVKYTAAPRVLTCALPLLQTLTAAARALTQHQQPLDNSSSSFTLHVELLVEIAQVLLSETEKAVRLHSTGGESVAVPAARPMFVPFSLLCSVKLVTNEAQTFALLARTARVVSSNDKLCSLTEATQVLDSLVIAMTHSPTEVFVREAVMPAVLNEKWRASSKYFGGKMPHHSIIYFFGTVLRSAHCNTKLIAKLPCVCQHSKEPLPQSLVVQPCTALCTTLAQELLVAQLLQFLSVYFEFLLQVRLSDVRRMQLQVDIMYTVRWTRMLRCMYSGSFRKREVEQLLLFIVAVSSLLTESDESFQRWTSADPILRDCDETSAGIGASFLSVVWNSTPTLTWKDLGQECNLLQLLQPHACGFVGYIPHESMLAVVPPSPLALAAELDSCCLSQRSADNATITLGEALPLSQRLILLCKTRAI